MKTTIFTILLMASTYCTAGDLPDPVLTPGVINPQVTQDNIKSTICVSGWTKTIRPSSSYTTKLKVQQMSSMKLEGKTSDYEEDHLISLELGGNPTDPKNLWPQLWYTTSGWGAHKKDVVETKLNKLVCDGKVSLADAQKMIATDWIAAYKSVVK